MPDCSSLKGHEVCSVFLSRGVKRSSLGLNDATVRQIIVKRM